MRSAAEQHFTDEDRSDHADCVGRKSDDSLFDATIATFEDDAGAYNQKDAEGFIKLNALRMRIAASKRGK